MVFLRRLLLSSVGVLLLGYLLPWIRVDSFFTALAVAFVLSLLNLIVKPVLVVLTIPLTVVTLGLFLLVINVIIVYMADSLVSGFEVGGFFSALIFSFLLSVFNSLVLGEQESN